MILQDLNDMNKFYKAKADLFSGVALDLKYYGLEGRQNSLSYEFDLPWLSSDPKDVVACAKDLLNYYKIGVI